MEQHRLKPTRASLHRFPDVVLHAGESSVKRHEQFRAAKAGDPVAANRLATQLISVAAVEQISAWVEGKPAYLVPIHALEAEGVNEIPAALANELSGRLGLPVNRSIVQVNSVGHTGADGYTRLANQAIFEGAVREGQRYVVVDDFVGQGGTLANLIGYIRSLGGKVLRADGEAGVRQARP